MAKDIPKNPSGYGMKLTSEEIEQAVAEMRGAQMNNLQHIVKDNTRFAMHMAVELCERGDFDSVNEALRWLMKERDDWNSRAERTCEPDEEGCCNNCGFDLVFTDVGVYADGGAYELDPPIYHKYCPNCGARRVGE